MSRRRTPGGEGSVYRRSSDGLWVAAVTGPSGRRRVRYATDERAAHTKRRQLLAEVEAGRPLPVGRTPTLGDWLARRWLDRLSGEVKAGHIEPGTADHYRMMIETHILPTDLARVRLDRVTADDVRAWQRGKLSEVNSRTGEVNSPRLVGAAHAALRRALNDALRDEVIARNAAELVKLPAGQHHPAAAVEEAELAALLAEILTDDRRELWLSMLALGTRKGETLAMRWSRTNLDAGTTQLRTQIVRQQGQPDPTTGTRVGHLVEKDLKTAASRATLAMPDLLTVELREHRRRQVERRLVARVWVDPDLIHTTGVGTACDPRNVNRWWAALCKRAGTRPLSPHDLRHAAAGLAHAAGASMKDIQAMLRHTRSSTTSDIYTHVFESVRAGTATKLDGALRKMREG